MVEGIMTEVVVKPGDIGQIEIEWPGAPAGGLNFDQSSQWFTIRDLDGNVRWQSAPGEDFLFGYPNQTMTLFIRFGTDNLETGLYSWTLNIVGADSTPDFDASGTIEVVPEYTETKKKTARPWDFLNPNTNYVDSAIQASRMEICHGCDRLNGLLQTCRECGCFMPAKTRLAHAECPLGKWGAVNA